VTKLPEGAVSMGSSLHSQNEVWSLDNRVLCMQAHPEQNVNFIEELIVSRLYDLGQLDDMLKNESLDRLRNS
jgi:GMP synthase-like glutamine amidotransferase